MKSALSICLCLCLAVLAANAYNDCSNECAGVRETFTYGSTDYCCPGPLYPRMEPPTGVMCDCVPYDVFCDWEPHICNWGKK